MASSLTLRAPLRENAAPEVLNANQRITQDTHGGIFVTLFYGILDPATGRLVYCNAGHNPPYLVTASGETHSLEKTGIPLGIFKDAAWQTAQPTGRQTAWCCIRMASEAAGPGEILRRARLQQVVEQARQRCPEL
jgi:hypothetical protein